MSERRLISYAEFASKIAMEREEDFCWADLERFDYDPPKERYALVSWCEERVDEDGEVHAGLWRVFRAGDVTKSAELHDLGVMLFGLPPWRRSQVLRVVGRLGSVEKAVEALQAPGSDFSYSFPYAMPEARQDAVSRVSRSQAAKTFAKPVPEERFQQRNRWRRARRSVGQGELF